MGSLYASGGFLLASSGALAGDPSCCCEAPPPPPPGDCGGCISGTAPGEFLLNVSGITPGTTSPNDCCTTINGSYSLLYQGGDSDQCTWAYFFPTDVCDGVTGLGFVDYSIDHIYMTIYSAGSLYTVEITFGNESNDVFYITYNTLTNPMDCSVGFSASVNGPQGNPNTICNYGAAGTSTGISVGVSPI